MADNQTVIFEHCNCGEERCGHKKAEYPTRMRVVFSDMTMNHTLKIKVRKIPKSRRFKLFGR